MEQPEEPKVRPVYEPTKEQLADRARMKRMSRNTIFFSTGIFVRPPDVPPLKNVVNE